MVLVGFFVDGIVGEIDWWIMFFEGVVCEIGVEEVNWGELVFLVSERFNEEFVDFLFMKWFNDWFLELDVFEVSSWFVFSFNGV